MPAGEAPQVEVMPAEEAPQVEVMPAGEAPMGRGDAHRGGRPTCWLTRELVLGDLCGYRLPYSIEMISSEGSWITDDVWSLPSNFTAVFH